MWHNAGDARVLRADVVQSGDAVPGGLVGGLPAGGHPHIAGQGAIGL
jgi:hypothetical protein